MDGERIIMVDLGDGDRIAMMVQGIGPEMVADKDLDAKLSAVTSSIEKVGRNTLEAVKRIGPSKATVELTFGVAVETGHLVAMLTKANGDASIKATLEWTREPTGG